MPRSNWRSPAFTLESGEAIRDFRQSYLVHGLPEADGSNVVLVTSSLGGDAHRMDFLIGEGLALDTSRYCVIATDAIGNGWSSSPSNSSTQKGMDFPGYSIRDMVNAQHCMLSETFGFRNFHAVVGASMGGMQALQWAVSYPDAMRAIVALVPLARTPAWTVASNEISRRILMLDSAWENGNYTVQPMDGWRLATAFLHTLASRSPDFLDKLCAGGTSPVALMNDLARSGLAKGFDANDWIYQTRAYDGHDVGKTPGVSGGTAGALGSISVPALVMGPALDLLNPAEDQRRVAEGIARAEYIEMPSIRGHMAAAPGDPNDVALMNDKIADFLERAREAR